jgi:ABC-type phosphate/phosphonate transport system substrate-binding protein
VYYSQIYVRNDSQFKFIEDLRGAIFAYNDDTSLSGYYCMKFFLLAYNLYSASNSIPFFSRAFKTGAHVNSLKALLEGRADAMALDCNVLKLLQQDENWREKLKELRPLAIPDYRYPIGVDTEYSVSSRGLLGPHPAQPLVVSKHLDLSVIASLRAALLALPRGVLEGIRAEQYVPVDSSYYENVTLMIKACEEGEHDVLV